MDAARSRAKGGGFRPRAAREQAGAALSPTLAITADAIDDAWGKAEEREDVAYVDWLLPPGCRSVGHAGEITTKDAILSKYATARRFVRQSGENRRMEGGA